MVLLQPELGIVWKNEKNDSDSQCFPKTIPIPILNLPKKQNDSDSQLYPKTHVRFRFRYQGLIETVFDWLLSNGKKWNMQIKCHTSRNKIKIMFQIHLIVHRNLQVLFLLKTPFIFLNDKFKPNVFHVSKSNQVF